MCGRSRAFLPPPSFPSGVWTLLPSLHRPTAASSFSSLSSPLPLIQARWPGVTRVESSSSRTDRGGDQSMPSIGNEAMGSTKRRTKCRPPAKRAARGRRHDGAPSRWSEEPAPSLLSANPDGAAWRRQRPHVARHGPRDKLAARTSPPPWSHGRGMCFSFRKGSGDVVKLSCAIGFSRPQDVR